MYLDQGSNCISIGVRPTFITSTNSSTYPQSSSKSYTTSTTVVYEQPSPTPCQHTNSKSSTTIQKPTNSSKDAQSSSKCTTASTTIHSGTKLSKTTPHSLLNTFTFVNIQGLCPQTKPSSVPYLKDLTNITNQLFLGLTETWLTDNHKEGELEIENYTFFHKNRDRIKSKYGRASGGVAFYVRDDIAPFFDPIFEFSNGVNEALMLFSKKFNTLLCIIYRQPTNPTHKSDAPELQELLFALTEKIFNLPGSTPDTYILGDFNIPHTPMNVEASIPTQNCNNQLLGVLNDFIADMNITQVIHKPTHRNGNILDFLLTNNTDNIFNYTCTPTIYSDHLVIDVSTHLNFDIQHKETEKRNLISDFDLYNFHSEIIDWDLVNEDLKNINWLQELDPDLFDPDLQYARFLDKCLLVMKKHLPLRKPPKKFSTIPRDRRILMRKRKKLSKKNFKTNKIKKKLIDIELLLQKSHKDERDKAELDASEKIKTNPKYFFSFAKRFTKTKPKVGPLRNPSTKNLTSNSKEMADILQNQYCSVFTAPKTNYSFPDSNQSIDTPVLEDFTFTEDDIIQQIDSIPANSAAGPDGLPAIFFKMCKLSLSKPLKLIWQNNFDQGTTPTLFKTSHITQFSRKGTKAQLKTIALLPSHLSQLKSLRR